MPPLSTSPSNLPTRYRAFEKLFRHSPDHEKLFPMAKKLVDIAAEMQEILGSSGGIHVLADTPSSYQNGLLIGSAACVLYSPTIDLDVTSYGTNPGVLSVLSQIRESRDRFQELHSDERKRRRTVSVSDERMHFQHVKNDGNISRLQQGQPQPQRQPQPRSQPQPQRQPRPQTHSQSRSQCETQPQSQPQPHFEQPQSQPSPQIQSQSRSRPETQPQSQPQPHSEQPQRQPQPHFEQPQRQPPPHPQSQSRSRPETTQPQPKPQSQPQSQLQTQPQQSQQPQHSYRRPRELSAVRDVSCASTGHEASKMGSKPAYVPKPANPVARSRQEEVEMKDSELPQEHTRTLPDTNNQRKPCSISEWDVIMKRRWGQREESLYIEDEHIAKLCDLDDVELRKLYRDTLVTLLKERVKHTAGKDDQSRFPFSLPSLTAPWAARYIRSSSYEFEVFDHATVNHYFEPIEKIKLVLAAFIQNEPLVAPIVSKLKQEMSPAPSTATAVRDQRLTGDLQGSTNTGTGAKNSADKGDEPHAGRSYSQKHDKRGSHRSSFDELPPTATRKSLRLQRRVASSQEQTTVFGCANGAKCFMANDKEAQDPSFITGSCTNCKRKVHDRCGGRIEGDELLVCLACLKMK